MQKVWSLRCTNPTVFIYPGEESSLPKHPPKRSTAKSTKNWAAASFLANASAKPLQYFESDGYCQALYATFYAAELGEVISATHEHELVWIPAEQLLHAHHAWATQKHLQRMMARVHAESVPGN